MDGQEFLLGSDMSRHQWGSWNPSYVDFLILKATEGRTWQDPAMDKFISGIADTVPDSPPFLGFYHYANASQNIVDDEVENFVKKISPHIGNCFAALDFEGTSLNLKYPDEWALDWCEKVERLTGMLPLLYVSASWAHKFPETLKKYPLWVAHYYVQKPFSKHYNIEPLIWQFTPKPFDVDIFYGNKADMVNLITRKGKFGCNEQ